MTASSKLDIKLLSGVSRWTILVDSTNLFNGNNESLSKEFEKTISTSGDVDVKVSKFEITTLNDNIISAEYEYQVEITDWEEQVNGSKT